LQVPTMVQESRERHGWLTIAVLVIIVARLALAALVYARPELALQNDTDRYLPIARGILSGQAYAWNTDRPGELLSTVGYPLFLAIVYAVAGSAPGAVAFAQLLITGMLGLAFHLGLRHLIGGVPAFVAAMIVLVDPLTMLWSMTLLTETLFAVLLGLASLLLVRWATSGNTQSAVLAGVSLGLACLVKPYGLLLAGLWAVAMSLHGMESGRWRLHGFVKGLQHVGMLLVPIALLVAPWIVRNALLWNCPSLSSVDRVTMRDYVAAKLIQETENVSLQQAQTELQARDPGVCPRGNAEYLRLILDHPQIYAKLHAAGTIPVLLGTGFDRWLEFFGVDYTLPDLWRPFMDGGFAAAASVLGAEIRQFPAGLGLMVALTLWQLLLYAGAIAGVLAYSRAKMAGARWSIVVLAISVLILVLTPGQGGHERFRVPVQPMLAILTSFAVVWGTLPRLRAGDKPRQTDDLKIGTA
jgi:Dolichyl-phosphate-mannose-protein mannosyltransferase